MQEGSPQRPRRRRRRLILAAVAAGVCVALVGVVALLPALLSLGTFRRWALSRMSARLDGTVEMDRWSLAWFSGFEFDGIRLKDADGRVVGEAERVRLAASVPDLLGSVKSLDALEVESPRVDLVVEEDGRTNLGRIFANLKAGGERLGLDVSGTVRLRNAAVRIGTGRGEPFTAKDLQAEVRIESLNRPIAYDVSARLGRNDAPLKVGGTLTAFREGRFLGAGMEGQATVSLGDLSLDELAPVALRLGAPVAFGGTLSAQVDARVAGAGNAQVKGEVGVRSLRLSGGPLGADRPTFDSVKATLDVERRDDTLTVRTFDLTSPLGTLHAAGTFSAPKAGASPPGRLAVKADLDVAAAAQAFPGTLRLRKDLTIEKGRARLDAQLASDGRKTTFEGRLDLADLAAVRAGGRIQPEGPVRLAAKGTLTDGVPDLESLTFESSFATAHAKGGPRAFDAELTCDLGKATRELAKFMDLGGRSAQGTARLTAHLAPDGDGGRTFRATLGITDLDLRGLAEKPIVEKSLSAELSARLAAPQDRPTRTFDQLALRLDSSLARASFAADRVALPRAPRKGRPLPEGLKITGGKLTAADADLERLALLARKMGWMPPATDLKGVARFAADVEAAAGTITVANLTAGAKGLVFQSGKRILREPAPTLSGRFVVRPDRRQVAANDVALQFSAGRLNVPEARIRDWAALAENLTARITGELDAASLARSAKGFMALPKDTALSGDLVVDLSLKPGAQGSIEAPAVAVRARDLDLRIGGKRLHQAKAAATLTGEANLAARRVKVRAAKVTLDHATVAVTGLSVPDWAKAPVGATGAVVADLDLAGALADAGDYLRLPNGLEVAGRLHLTAEGRAVAGAQHMRLDASVRGLRVTRPGFPNVAEEEVKVAASADLIEAQERLDFKGVRLASGMLDLSGAGSYTAWTGARRLRAKGTLGCDFERLAPFIASLTGQKLTITGKRSSPFEVDVSLRGKTWRDVLRQTTARAGLYVKRARYLGLETGEFVLGIRSQKAAALRTALETDLNRGRMTLRPTVDLSGEAPVLRLPKDAPVLSDVEINEEMANAFLSRALPLFYGCMRPQGKVSLKVSQMSLPLDETLPTLGRAAGVLSFKAVALGPGGWLQKVLSLADRAGKTLRLEDQEVAVAFERGRFRHGPIRFHSGKYPVSLSGSVGLDRTLDMVLEVEQRRKGDRRGYRVRIPVTGTLSNPRVDTRALLRGAAEDLLRRKLEDLLEKQRRKR